MGKERILKHYTVCTPQYQSWSYDYYDPPEWGADCVSVEAYTKREAKILAVRKMRAEGMDWVLDQQSDRASPFTGLKVFLGTCEHGYCWCDICTRKIEWEECSECTKKWEKEDAVLYGLSPTKE